MLKNTSTAYGNVAKLFHWIIGLGIIAMLAFGLYMEGLPPEPSKFALYGIHKSVGIMLLILMGGRVLWRLYTGAPNQIAAHPKWECMLAVSIHYLLYIAAILMPLSGWAMSSAGGHPVSLFGLPVPPLVPENKEWGSIFNAAHSFLGWVLIVSISLHVLGTLKHVFIDRDETLKRMLP